MFIKICIPKSIKTFLIKIYFYCNAANINQTKKAGQFLIWQQIPKLKNIQYFNKILISQLIAKIPIKQQSLNQMRHYLTEHNQI